MKFVKRNRKFFSILFLLITVESVVQPTLTYALTTGPHQPEYTSYEQPGATDMVNLLTGDFTFSLPILEVPGPEGSFSVPLTYNAGIGPEQEASWVGLGWTLNVGAITREINQYPDDASSEIQRVNNVNLQGVRGWTSSALGLGNIGWNTAQGSYGAISLLGVVNFSYDRGGLNSGGIMGVNVSGGSVDFDMAQFGMGAMTIASLGVAGLAAETGAYAFSSSLKAAASQLVSDAALSSAFSPGTPQINPAAGYWAYNRKKEEQGLFHSDYWIWLDQTRNEQMFGILNLDKAPVGSSVLKNYYTRTGTYPNYNYSLPSAIDYSSLNGNNIYSPLPAYFYDVNNTGTASDINYYMPAGTAYKDAQSPASLAEDNFSVKALGISGSIKPYRLDVGSVSMPRAMTQLHIRYNPIQFSSYKVPFVYNGILSSNYLYHTGNATPLFNYGLSNNVTSIAQLYYYADGFPRPDTDYPEADVDFLNLNISDNIFGSQRVRQDIVNNTYRIPQSNHIEWVTNGEIAGVSGSFSNNFLDYFSSSSSPSRSGFRSTYPFNVNRSFFSWSPSSNFLSNGQLQLPYSGDLSLFTTNQVVTLKTTVYNSIFDLTKNQNGTITTPQTSTIVSASGGLLTLTVPSTLPPYGNGKYFSFEIVTSTNTVSQNGIGGFSITAANGQSFHFALPVYDYQSQTTIKDKDSPTQIYTNIKRDAPFANTWLLTGITGPDFVDRNSNGIIDEADWGYWVKFNYGKYADNYKWSIPFNGDQVDPENSSLTSSNGFKQLYYLNSIETRSHVALLIKDFRSDNKDASQLVGSLRLSEIALLKKDDYKKLFSVYGQQNDSGTINGVWMNDTFYPSSGATTVGNFVIQNASKRIKFTHNYNLCQNTPNSSDVNKGKLTLTRVSIVGRNGTQVVPDYKFDYGNSNPQYDANKWDGWGMYNSSGTSSYNTHAASTSEADGSAWSLSQITTPQGSTIGVTYERDKYSTVSGLQVGGSFSASATTILYSGTNTMNIYGTNGNLVVGDVIKLTGTASAICPSTGLPVTGPISGNYSVASISNNIVTVSPNFGSVTSCQSGSTTSVSYSGSFTKINAIGGGLRVGSITLQDQSTTQKTRYLYTNDDGTSSGVVAQEAPYTKSLNFDFNTLPGYPMTPVLYSQVTQLVGTLSTDSDFNIKYVYKFESPSTNQVVLNSDNVQFNGTIPGHNATLLSLKNQISDYTSKIGSLKSIEVYDQFNSLTSSTSMAYTNQPLNSGGVNQYQGYYSSGTLMHDKIILGEGSGYLSSMFKMNRSTTIKYPYTLQSVISQKDGFTSKVDNVAWDFISGQVIEKNNTSALGLKTKTVTVPAYTIAGYAQMGPKALNVGSNKNMLAQTAAEYTYLLDAQNNIIGLIGGTATTWNNAWSNYRDYDGVSAYVEGSGTTPSSVWRKNKTYVYKGTVADRQNDGSLKTSTFNTFNFSSSTNSGWQQTGEITRYDHYSLPVESKNTISGICSSTKADFNNKFVLASAANANYYEFAFSGAEDGDNTSVFFGGEVARGNGTIVTGAAGSICHTGQAAVQVASGNKTFIYKPVSLTSGRTYRAQVWTNSANGTIYYVAGGTEQVPSNISTAQVGSWYRITASIPSNATEIGVKSTSGTASFDDFKFQPSDGVVTANVYDVSTGYLTYTIGNDNMYTRYQYDDRGIVMKTYIESIKYNGERLVTERKEDYKRFHTNP